MRPLAMRFYALLFKNHNNEKLITIAKAITPTASTPPRALTLPVTLQPQ